jgi:integrase
MASIRKRKFGAHKELECWVVDYRDQHGKRHLKTFATKKEAESWKVGAQHEIQQGTHTPASTSVTVEEAWRMWIAECDANGLEFSTIRQRRQHLTHHVTPFIGRQRLSSLTTPMVHEFDSALRNAGRSLAMRRKVLTNLKTMLSFAQGRGLAAQNVARSAKVKSDAREAAGPLRSGVDLPTMSELRTIMETATGRWRPLVIVAIFTGMRLSELRGLPWRDVDLDAGVIHVRQRATFRCQIGPPKSRAGLRDIPLAPMARNALKQWRKECPEGEYVFGTSLGTIIRMSSFYQLGWYPLMERCGVSYGFHSLRHAAASLFIRHLKWTPKKIQTVMGHGSIRMTYDHYGHWFEDTKADREDMAKIEAAILAA